MRHGEIGVELDGTLEEGNRGCVTTEISLDVPLAERLQRLERGRRRLLDRRVVLLDRGERLAEVSPQTGHCLAECGQYLFFRLSLGLLRRQRLTGGTVEGVHREDEVGPQSRDLAGHQRRNATALADLASDFLRNCHVRPHRHP